MLLQTAIDKCGKQKVECREGAFRPADPYVGLAGGYRVENDPGNGLRVIFGCFCAAVQYGGQAVVRAGLYRARRDMGNRNPGALQFTAQGIAEGAQASLCRRINSHVRQGDETDHRTDIHDLSVAAPLHGGQDGL